MTGQRLADDGAEKLIVGGKRSVLVATGGKEGKPMELGKLPELHDEPMLLERGEGKEEDGDIGKIVLP